MSETITSRPSRRRRGKVLPRLVAGGSVALLITAAVLGYRAAAEPAQTRYRTVVAGPATVSQSISLSGTVHHVSQVSVTFPTAGLVVSVDAKAGDTVVAGQPLATIDSGPLRNAVLDAEAAWRAAVSKLDTDQTAYDAASGSTTTTTTGTAANNSARTGSGTSNQGQGGASGGPNSGSSGQPSGSTRPSGSAQPSGSTRPSGSTQPSGSAQPSGSTRPSGSGQPSGSGGPSGSAPPTVSVQDAAMAIAALQATLDSVQTNVEILTTQCLPAGLPSTLPSDLPTSHPPVATVTATQTVTATATRTVTVTAAAPGSASDNAASTASGAATVKDVAARTATTTRPGQTQGAVAPSSAASSNSGQPTAGLPLSPECRAAIVALATLPQTLNTQLGEVQRTLLGAQASLTAQAMALQAQAAQLQAQAEQLKQQGIAMQAQAAALQQQAAALQQQAAALQQQSAALQQQAAAAQAQAAAAQAASAKLGAAGLAKVTEATLITDRANVESTSLALQQARDRLSNATVTSPIAGVVATIPWIAGQSTTAVSAATVIGPGAIEVTVPVALAQRPQVEVGQSASVSSAVTQDTLDGRVTRIGLLPVASTTSNAAAAAAAAGGIAAAAGGVGGSSSSNVSYPVVVTVPSGGSSLPEGSRVQVGIVTAKVAAPVAVPVSAVTPTSLTTGTLQVLENGVAEHRTVQIGINGGGIIQILSGVSAGETVIVADMELPLPGISIATGRPSGQGGPFQPNQRGENQPTQGGRVQPTQGGQQPGTQTSR